MKCDKCGISSERSTIRPCGDQYLCNGCEGIKSQQFWNSQQARELWERVTSEMDEDVDHSHLKNDKLYKKEGVSKHGTQ